MTFEEKLDRMEGLFAYDTGCTDSGARDDQFKYSLRIATDNEKSKLLTELAKQYLNSKQGYTIEDIRSLITWADDELDFDI